MSKRGANAVGDLVNNCNCLQASVEIFPIFVFLCSPVFLDGIEMLILSRPIFFFFHHHITLVKGRELLVAFFSLEGFPPS